MKRVVPPGVKANSVPPGVVEKSRGEGDHPSFSRGGMRMDLASLRLLSILLFTKIIKKFHFFHSFCFLPIHLEL